MVVKSIRPYLKKYSFFYLVGIVSLFLVDLFQVKIPEIIGETTDGIRMSTYVKDDIANNIVRIVTIALVIIIGRFVWRYFIFGTARKIEYHLRNDFFSHLEKLSLSYFNTTKTGDLMSHATNDLNTIRMALGQGVLFAFDFVLVISFVIYKMVNNISLKLTLVAVIPLPLIAILGVGFGKVMFKRFKSKQEAFSKMTEQVQENISGIRVVKAFVQEDNEIEAFAQVNKYNFKKNIQVVKLFALLHPAITLISGLSTLLTIAYGGYLTMVGQISLGQFIAFTQYLGMLVWPMMAFSMTINIVSQGKASMKRFQEIMDVEPEIYDNDTICDVKKIDGNIEFKNFSFKYNEEQDDVLSNINVEIKKGDTIGILGRTGSGKTTFVNMLLRLFNPQRGTLFIDGIDILDIPIKTLRSQIGYVPQDNYLFSSSIKDNIKFGARNKSDDEVENAAKMADVHQNIVDFSEGYETVIGERGTTLSGGQKQRVSIARALIKEPPVLILDDSVSAVDTKTEEKILGELEKVRSSKTTIIIAHRISTLKQADKILVMDEGRIVEQGTNDELLALDGLYASMLRKQQLEKALNDEV